MKLFWDAIAAPFTQHSAVLQASEKSEHHLNIKLTINLIWKWLIMTVAKAVIGKWVTWPYFPPKIWFWLSFSTLNIWSDKEGCGIIKVLSSKGRKKEYLKNYMIYFGSLSSFRWRYYTIKPTHRLIARPIAFHLNKILSLIFLHLLNIHFLLFRVFNTKF